KEALKLELAEFRQLLQQLMQEGFNGYIVLMVQGLQGIEEGILVFKNGQPVGCYHELMKLNHVFYSDRALNAFLNASAARKGIIDVFRLDLQQVDLVLSFNEKIKLSEAMKSEFPKKINELPLKEFSSSFIQEALQALPAEDKLTKTELMKKLGLEGMD
ncbi:DUF2226 domain-containing protein, partial [archaeon]|nr:DUF2226 domain-containing protein [archaeon]